MLGLAPMLVTDASSDLLKRQFLYQFIQAQETLEGEVYLESYAFNCFEFFAIGGSVSDYKSIGCQNNTISYDDNEVT